MVKPQGKRVGPARQRGIWRKTFYMLKNIDETTFLFSCGSKGACIISKITGRAYVCCRFGSFYAYAAQKRFKPSRNGYDATMQDPHHGSDRKRRSSNKRGSTSIRSRSWPFRDSAITRTTARQFYRSESSAKNTGTPVSGSAVKNHG